MIKCTLSTSFLASDKTFTFDMVPVAGGLVVAEATMTAQEAVNLAQFIHAQLAPPKPADPALAPA